MSKIHLSTKPETIDDIVRIMLSEKFYRDGKEARDVKRIVTGYAKRIKAAKKAMKIASNAVVYDGQLYLSRSREDGYETCLTGDVVAYKTALETIVKRIEDSLNHTMNGMFLVGCLQHIMEYAKEKLSGIRN